MSTDDTIIEEEIVTRIQIRHDTLQAWIDAQSELINKGNLAFGEFGLATQTIINTNDDNEYILEGRIGINETPTKFNDCPVVFMATLYQDSEDPNIYVSTKPVTYLEPEGGITQNTIITWNENEEKWEARNQAVFLDSYPTQNGTLIYDSNTNLFSVGEIIMASEIDGGNYGETDV